MKKLLYLLLFLFPVLAKAQTRTGVIFYDDAEATDKPRRYGTATTNTANFSLGYSWYNWVSPNYVQRSTNVARKGNVSYYHYITDLAGSQYDGYEYVKAEFNWGYAPSGVPSGTDGANTRPPLGLNWFAYSTYIPTSNTDNTSITSLGFTMKSWPDNYTTPSYLAMERGRYYLFITRINTSNQVLGTLKLDCGPVVKGVWVDWVVHRNFTNQDSGYVRIYKNKQLVQEYLGGNWKTGSQWAKEPFFLIGNYKWAFRTDWFEPPGTTYTDMYTDEIRIGNYSSNLESVSPDMAGGGSNTPPVVNAGVYQEYSNTVTSVTLSGTASDPGGSVASTQWTRVSGPNNPTIVSPTGLTTNVTGMVPGIYKFRLTATDNNFATSFAEVDVKINRLPNLNIVYDSEVFGTDSIIVSASPVDLDGSISSVSWTQIAGNSATIVSPSSNTTVIKDLIPGDYIFRFTATDSNNESTFDDIFVQVRPASRFRIKKYSKFKD